jgi:hypothetical protein
MRANQRIYIRREELKVTRVLTKLDGMQAVQWWEKSDFQGRETNIYTADVGEKFTLQSSMPTPDDFIVCDFCNKDIIVFPCPVIFHKALCKDCYEEIITKEGDK